MTRKNIMEKYRFRQRYTDFEIAAVEINKEKYAEGKHEKGREKAILNDKYVIGIVLRT